MKKNKWLSLLCLLLGASTVLGACDGGTSGSSSSSSETSTDVATQVEAKFANFIQTAKQIKTDSRPIKIKMIKPNTIWDDFEQKQKTLNNEIELSNDAMVAWEGANQNDR